MRVGNKVCLRDGGSSGYDGVRLDVWGSECNESLTGDLLFFLVFHRPDKIISLIAPSSVYKASEDRTKSNVYKRLDAKQLITIQRPDD